MADQAPLDRLVVIGNGMAGARTVEEILSRGGGSRFEITMIGDEPYGNYNRIMLSHVLAGENSIDDDDLMLNPMAWYRENDVKLYARVTARCSSTDSPKRSPARAAASSTTTSLIIATGSTTFFPNMDGLREPDGRLAAGCSVSGPSPTPTACSRWRSRGTTCARSSSAAVCSVSRPPTGCAPRASTSTWSTPPDT